MMYMKYMTNEWEALKMESKSYIMQCLYCSSRLEVIHRVVGPGLQPLVYSLVCKVKEGELIFSSFNLITKNF